MLPAHISSPRILFYAVNGLGLGHVTRLLAIAGAVRRQRPLTQFLFLTTSEADYVIYKEGFSSVKLPSRSATERTGLRPRVFNKLTHAVVTSTVSAFNPAIMVVDTFPAGASQELLSTLSWEMRRAFVFRAQQEERMADPFFQSALGVYDLCIAPHEEGSIALQIPENVRQVWTGEIFIRDSKTALSREDARTLLGLPQAGNVLYVSFGGGGDEEIDHALKITLEAAKELDWTVAIADAPLQVTSSARFRAQNIIPVSHYPMAECFAAFDGAVSAAGYNTVSELLHFGVPTVVIPFPRGLDDQFARAQRLTLLGAVLSADLSVNRLRSQIVELQKADIRATLSAQSKALITESGADAAAQAILSLL